MDIDFAMAFVWFAAFLFSTTIHEAMHALAAWRLGDPTITQGWAVGWASCPTIRCGRSATRVGPQRWRPRARRAIS